jgi:biotin transport system substrate-specific component
MSTSRSAVTVWTRLDDLATPRARRIVGVVSFAVLTALGARMALPIPGTLVPFTFQPLAVLLAGGLLGARLGASSQALYLAAGALGLPVFATGFLLGPTAGYLLAFPAAALVVGALGGRGLLRNLAASLAGLGVVYAGGVAWLALLVGGPAALSQGVLPFLLPDLVKVAMAAVIVTRLRASSRGLFAA